MSRGFDRGLKRAAELIRPERPPEPDFTGWTPVEVMTWKVKNGESFEEMVRAAKVARENKRDDGTEDRERLASEPEAPAKPAPTEKPKRKRRKPAPPKPEPQQWWEEKARWRLRGPADYDWEDVKPNECIYEYDPLTWDDRDWEDE
jgi:hypothetical protein